MTGRFLEIFLKYSFVKIWPPLWPHYISWNGYKQYWIYTIWWYFNINFNITSRMVFERQFFRDLPYTFLSKYSTPLWPHPSLGDKIFFQKLNVHYLGKPHYQFQIYWPTGILGKEFLKGQYFLKKKFLMMHPLCRANRFIWTNLNSLVPEILSAKLFWN